MAGNRNKEQARRRLAEMGVKPGWLAAEEAAAFFEMSVPAFVAWCGRDPAAPQPHWLGNCKRWSLNELDAYGESSDSTQDIVMGLINAAKSTQVR